MEQAVEMLPELSDGDVVYVEQPVRELEEWKELVSYKEKSAPPLIADESIRDINDIDKVAKLVDGVNVKVRKLGGIAGAKWTIALARTRKLKILIGCMIESSIAVSAAAQLAPLADFIDLDAALLIKNDPYEGVVLDGGVLRAPVSPGHGARPR